jgi:hypothetical protein
MRNRPKDHKVLLAPGSTKQEGPGSQTQLFGLLEFSTGPIKIFNGHGELVENHPATDIVEGARYSGCFTKSKQKTLRTLASLRLCACPSEATREGGVSAFEP